MLAAAYLLLYLACGVAIARFQFPRKSPVMRAWLGLCLGILLLMWMPALLAFAVRFSGLAHALALLPLGGVTAAAFYYRDKRPARRMEQDDFDLLFTALLIAVPLTVLGGYLQYTHVLRPAADGSLHGGQAT